MQMTIVKQFLRDNRGVTIVEYGLIAAFISLIVIAGVSLLGTNLSKEFSTISSDV